MIKAVFFDFFGVLYPDTFWGLADIHLPKRDNEKQQELHDLIKRVDLNMIDREMFWDEAAKIFNISLESLKKELNKFGGVDKRLLNTCEKLRENGIKTGIISNAGPGFIDREFGEVNIKDYFDLVVLSGEVLILKPQKEIYELAAEKAGVSINECLFFDDIQSNVEGAISAGMHAKLYVNYKQALEDIYELIPNMDD